MRQQQWVLIRPFAFVVQIEIHYGVNGCYLIDRYIVETLGM